MSKLTREVKFLQESDRPKKAEPLTFTEWVNKHMDFTIVRNDRGFQSWHDELINDSTKDYATYLQEFNAEEKPIELEFFFSTSKGLEKNTHTVFDDDIIVYLGKCERDGDLFSVKSKDGYIRFYSGKLNSGRY